MIDVAIGISWLPVKPDGSKRVPLNFSIRSVERHAVLERERDRGRERCP